MLTYSFADIRSGSLYHHLYQCVKNDILSGELAVGTKLPSKRSFAKNLGVSNITVENAYAQLQAEGYIYSIPKKGFYVQEVSGHMHLETPTVAKAFPQEVSHRQYVADFVSNRINPGQFPFSV